MYRIFTCSRANYLPQQCLSFVLQWIRPYSSHLFSHLWPLRCSVRQGRPCTRSDVVWSGGKKKKSLWSSTNHIGLPSGQCVCTHKGDMLSVNVDCIRSGWPFRHDSLLWYKGCSNHAGKEERLRKEGRTRPLCFVYIKTRFEKSSCLCASNPLYRNLASRWKASYLCPLATVWPKPSHLIIKYCFDIREDHNKMAEI